MKQILKTTNYKLQTWKLLKQNPQYFQRYFIKEYLIKACRKFFENRNYHELESPILTSALPQERYLNVLETKISLKDSKSIIGYITPTTETFNKKVLAAGLGEHFVITKVARGLEQISPNHSPEFTMLEWYHLNATYKDLMNDCEELFKFIIKQISIELENEKKLARFPISNEMIERFKSGKLDYQGQDIDFLSNWYRISIPEAIKRYTGIKLEDIQTEEDFRTILKQKGYKVSEKEDWQTMYEWLFTSEIEPQFPTDKPVFVYDFPQQICVLTKISRENPLVCERVELYLAGKEIANGYTELIDWKEQKKRFLEERRARKLLELRPIKMDFDLIDAIKSGLPNVAGIGMGLDRVAMILADAKDISEINYFPGDEL